MQSMLYYPEARVPSGAELAARGLRFWPDGREGYRGFAGAAGSDPVRGTVIVFHGNAGTADDRDYYLPPLQALGFRVILAEYPGYGGRAGTLEEHHLVADARETLRAASEMYGGPVFLLGESLGCGVAAGAAREAPSPAAGLVLITPWNTLLAVARDHYPWLPVSWFVKDRYDSGENLKDYPGKIAVAGAEWDEVVPLRHARDLFARLPGQKRMWVVSGAGHNDWSVRVDLAWWREIMDFVA